MVSPIPEPTEAPSSYSGIADALRRRINGGVYAPGSQLPTQDSLRREFGGVSRDTVQSALKALQEEGLLENGGRGRAARVLEQVRSSFDAHIGRAFTAQDVTLDIFSLTSQTVTKSVGAPIEAIKEGQLQPRSITVRLLLPSPEGEYQLPVAIDDPSDERPLKRLQGLVRSYAVVLENQFETLRESERVPSVSIDIRVLRLEPGFKFCIANGEEALFGLYQVGTNDIQYGTGETKERIRTYDFHGLDTDVFIFRRDTGQVDTRDGAMFSQLSRWFDTRWSTIARPFPRSY
ncbi:winged helix-turn-helix domain-containing protein [Streptomyces niveus]|uniref:winged helix-turn-helix domain-containing protein n=1 Tax=Streptomyces niveus TaxID=193462 RepID=UPI0036E1EBEF